MSARPGPRPPSIPVYKSGLLVRAQVSGAKLFVKPVGGEPIADDRICAIDTESLKDRNGVLRTVLASIATKSGVTVVEAGTDEALVELIFDVLFAEPGFASAPVSLSQVTQRKKRLRNGRPHGRDGDHVTIPPIIAEFFKLFYDVGQMFADSPHLLRSIAAGADAYTLNFKRYRTEVRRMVAGGAAHFDFRIIERATRRVIRLLGEDLAAYWRTSLAVAAESLGLSPKLDIESELPGIFERPRESLSAAEWATFKEYAARDAVTTRELGLRTRTVLMDIDPVAVRKNGTIPPSGPAASARMTFAGAFLHHPNITTWRRPPLWCDRMGSLAYAAGNVFCNHPGIHQGMDILDLKSAYLFALSVLPDPVTMTPIPLDEGPFDWTAFKGRFGAVLISGRSLDAVYPPLRVHNPLRRGRLRYIYGPFQYVWTTIPEVVLGCARGALENVRVHRGFVMDGYSATSFFRSQMIRFFRSKEDQTNASVLQSFAKGLGVYIPGKLAEIKSRDHLVPTHIPVPDFIHAPEICRSIVALSADLGGTEHAAYWGETAAIAQRAMEFYRTRFKHGNRRPSEHAVTVYLEGLMRAGEPYNPDNAMPLEDYLIRHREYRCGHYYMPSYASQVTGLVSAQLSAMAMCVNAKQGDTDSVHFIRPKGVASVDAHPGFDHYFSIMKWAGYQAPRKRGEGYEDGIPGAEAMGIWDLKTARPSEESILVRPKVYSHRINAPSGLEFAQAHHGLTHFDDARARWERTYGVGTSQERRVTSKRILERQLHEALRTLLGTKQVSYAGRPRPVTLREAVLGDRQIGEFVSSFPTAILEQDPATAEGADGRLHWKPLSPEERVAMTEFAKEQGNIVPVADD